jgi:DUF4097 and DUF4098 domain-containing protein YvlB
MRALPLLLLAAGCTPAGVDVPFEPIVVTDEVTRLDLDNGDGDVFVTATADDFVTIDATLASEDVTITPQVAGGILSLQTTCGADVTSEDCVADFELLVPEAVESAITTASGDIVLVGMGGDADLSTSSGSVEVDGFSADTLLVAGDAGIVLGLRLAAEEVVVDSGVGPIELNFEQRPLAVTGTTTSGDIQFVVPGGPYRVDATTDSGTVVVEGIDEDPDASEVLTATSGAGDIRIAGI